jgi:hypothetical protein
MTVCQMSRAFSLVAVTGRAVSCEHWCKTNCVKESVSTFAFGFHRQGCPVTYGGDFGRW